MHTSRLLPVMMATVSGLLFFILSFFIGYGRFVTTDFTIMVKVQDHVPHRADGVLAGIVDVGSMELMTGILALVLFSLPLRPRIKLLFVVVYCAGLGLILVGKSLLHHPAPPYLFHRDSPGLGLPISHVQVQYSYPSGHSFRSVFVAMLCIWWAVKTRNLVASVVAILIFGLSLLIVGALVILGKHWPTDVVGGTLLAVALVLGTVGITHASFKR